MLSTLVVNEPVGGGFDGFEPLAVVSANRSVSMVLNDRVHVLDSSPLTYRGGGREVQVPYVVQLRGRVDAPERNRSIFSRRGVLVRDRFTCVYCGGRATTIDHVHPQSLGGRSTYENCVAACSPCNERKADRLLGELGWSLTVQPVAPLWYEIALFRLPMGSVQHQVWLERLSRYDDSLLGSPV